jgi:hypothetical protein
MLNFFIKSSLKVDLSPMTATSFLKYEQGGRHEQKINFTVARRPTVANF